MSKCKHVYDGNNRFCIYCHSLNPKVLTPSERVRLTKDRKEAAGLKNYKIDMHPDDIEVVRKYVKKRPATKAAIKKFEES